MLTLHKNGNNLTFTYSYDLHAEKREPEPDVIVDDRPAPSDIHAVSLLSSPQRTSYRGGVVTDEAAAGVEGFAYEGDCLAAVSDAYRLGSCRCGGQHGEGRWLIQAPVGFFAGDSNVYHYVADAPLPFDDEK